MENLKITFSSSYGFDHNWTLSFDINDKHYSYYLGQDVKFCQRVLGMTTRQVIDKVDGLTGNIKKPEENLLLAQFIVDHLAILDNIDTANPWDYCAQ